ncbi:hypothetical protein DD235_12240 [Corticimicrobacter populi]|uniref:DUF4153 domain-containing protein n=2 Tax=Corticimicrobacter populi TaxID=2175229 RepID=A0A2V1K1Z1_9BURK|nr:hypothetical protein DD235_12240 [Corticimicrobacter populi]
MVMADTQAVPVMRETGNPPWLLFGLAGLLQGLLLWLLFDGSAWLREVLSPSLFVALLNVVLAVPLSLYLTQDIPGLSGRRRTGIVVGMALLLALLGAHAGWVNDRDVIYHRFESYLSNGLLYAILGFTLIPLLAHVHWQGRVPRWSYAALFETAWRNGLMTVLAAILTGIFWGVFGAGMGLLGILGLKDLVQHVFEGYVVWPLTMMAFGCAIALLLARSQVLVTLRRFWLSLNQVFLPLLLLLAAVWAVAMLFTGITPLLETNKAALFMLWFIALAVHFVNTAWQDGEGEAPFRRSLRNVMGWLWLILVLAAALAAWALYLRIDQHGWTRDRIWAALVLLLAVVYVAGYAASLWQRGRRWFWSVAQTNIVAALLMCVALVLLLSPLLDPSRIAVNSQVARLERGEVKPDEFDFYMLLEQSGRYGQQALTQLAELSGSPAKEEIARLARKMQVNRGLTAVEDLPVRTDEEMLAALKILPGPAAMPPGAPEGLIAALRALSDTRTEQACLDGREECLLWPADLNGDGRTDLMLIVDQKHWGQVTIFSQDVESKRWQAVAEGIEVNAPWLEGMREGQARVVPSPWHNIEVEGRVMRLRSIDP